MNAVKWKCSPFEKCANTNKYFISASEDKVVNSWLILPVYRELVRVQV